jgi:uncharacterized protein (TIGR03086 family)
MKPSEQFSFQTVAIRNLIAGTSPDQMDNVTPCDNWKTRDLINHLVGGAHMFGAAFKGQSMETDPGAPAPDLLGDDPVAAWDGAIQAFTDGADVPGALDKEIALPFANLPGTVVLELLKFDVLVHAWDLAQATNQPFSPPDDVVEPAMGAAQMIINPESRNGDSFAAESTPPSDATPIERLAAFTGRSIQR